ncbi:hypothetical protein [Brevundimonas sp. NIBR11]|uniref:hypothetical protein n=1 Tax=Brevundimonas sp. NIBR11 TaxID=3015999 RepID=UPI0022F0E7A7|nr:hypothetical protein [Brevundimonas sp. NIBR11]WGM32398.1 hypothetical protein KKHFBJBL_02650 [Brevundimonas sp. NIBR11]
MIALLMTAALTGPLETSPLEFECDVEAFPPYRMNVTLSLRPGSLNAVTLSETFRSSSTAVTMDHTGWSWEDYRHDAYGTNHIDRRTLAYRSDRDGHQVIGQCRKADEAETQAARDR